ncbi:hypothetical protein C8R43DRAFT_981575 [Mycena crocata]|nr:hypothetical protein C8R43DRAFT_981575 [Mycena crocata]
MRWKLLPVSFSMSSTSTIRGMILGCQSDPQNYPFTGIDIDATHPIHTRGVVCPVSAKVGLPLVMYRHLQTNPLSMGRDADLDNQRATYLMIDPQSGYAPPEWQSCVGSVTVMRRDGKPLTLESIETIWMYHDHLLDCFGDGAPPKMTSKRFIAYCEKYKANKLLNGHAAFTNMPVPL